MLNPFYICCVGDTDWFSFAIDRDQLIHTKKILGTSDADALVAQAGPLLCSDRWDELRGMPSPGSTGDNENALVTAVLSLIGGTRTLEHALSTGHDLLSCIVYRGNGSDAQTPAKYGFRMLGSQTCSTADGDTHFAQAQLGLLLAAQAFSADVQDGLIHPDSPVIDTLRNTGMLEPASTSCGPTAETAGVQLVEVYEDGNPKTAVACFADPDQAAAWATVPSLSIEIVTGHSATPFGPLSFLLWVVGLGSSTASVFEQFIDPKSLGGAGFINLSTSDNFDFILLDRTTGDQKRHIVYPSGDVFQNFVKTLPVEFLENPTDLNRAQSYVQENVSVIDLLPERLKLAFAS